MHHIFAQFTIYVIHFTANVKQNLTLLGKHFLLRTVIRI